MAYNARPLKSEQIGLSAHQNLYSTKTLSGNWVEERMATEFSAKENAPSMKDAASVARETYKPYDAETLVSLAKEREKATMQTAGGCLHADLLFGHGSNVEEFSRGPTFCTEQSSRLNETAQKHWNMGSLSETQLASKKQEEWKKDTKEFNPFDTISRTSYTGARNDDAASERHTKVWGSTVSKELGQRGPVRCIHETGLRTPFEYKATPLKEIDTLTKTMRSQKKEAYRN